MSTNNNDILVGQPHRRYNALTGDWILVSPHRTKRPWLGRHESPTPESCPAYDPTCYLCPGNGRANGVHNPKYGSTFVFDNDFAAILPGSKRKAAEDTLFTKTVAVSGECRVMCFSPRHDLTLPLMSEHEIRNVIDVWGEQTLELGRKYRWVQIFENKGEVMGCSNPHPHCQIWASSSLPNEVAKEHKLQKSYAKERKGVLLLDYMKLERKTRSRLLLENDHWTTVVPFWAVWPFETLLVPRRHVLRFPDLKSAERDALAELLKRLLTKYDNLFNVSFPYTMGWHGAQFQQGDCSHWQLHAHIYPPLLRSATVKKFMVGYEMLSEPQRDFTPEQAVEQLREVPEVHYSIAASASTRRM